MIGQGLIQAVRIAKAGSYLAADAALAATSLVLESVLDFSTDGGQLTLNGVTYTYTAANYDTNTLTLSTGLTGAALTVDRVDVSPRSTEKLALVTTAGAGDAVSARIPHALVDRVPEGIREPGDEESVQYSLDNGEFVITDVVGREPVIEAQYLDPALTEALAANEAALEELNTVTLPALQTDLDAAEADVATAQADITTLTGTTIPGLAADIAAAQADVDAILPITTTDISDDAITTPKINAGAITAVKIAADTITASQIAASAITATELAANAVTAGKIAAGTIVAADIAADTITASQIAAGAITATELATDSVIAAKIQAGAITGTKIAADAIDGKTITGSFIRTAATGARIAINDPSYPNQTVFYTNDPDETAPGGIRPIGVGGSSLQLRGPDLTAVASPATFDLGADNGTGESSAELDADSVRVFGDDTQIDGFSSLRLGDGSDYISFAGHTIDAETGPLALVGTGATTSNGVPIVTTTDTQTLTNKNLTSGTNTFPTSLVTTVGTQSLSNKDLSNGTNTFPTSLATTLGAQTLSNKNLTSGNTFPTSLATLTGTQTLTNKDLTASTNTFPGQMLTQSLSAACSATIGLTTTEVDLTGATVTFSTTKTNARYLVTGSFYFGAASGSATVASGKLSVDGTVQTAFAQFTGTAATTDRTNSSQTWSGTLASTGSHTLKLRGVAGASGVNVNPTHTTITVMVFE